MCVTKRCRFLSAIREYICYKAESFCMCYKAESFICFIRVSHF